MIRHYGISCHALVTIFALEYPTAVCKPHCSFPMYRAPAEVKNTQLPPPPLRGSTFSNRTRACHSLLHIRFQPSYSGNLPGSCRLHRTGINTAPTVCHRTSRCRWAEHRAMRGVRTDSTGRCATVLNVRLASNIAASWPTHTWLPTWGQCYWLIGWRLKYRSVTYVWTSDILRLLCVALVCCVVP